MANRKMRWSTNTGMRGYSEMCAMLALWMDDHLEA